MEEGDVIGPLEGKSTWESRANFLLKDMLKEEWFYKEAIIIKIMC